MASVTGTKARAAAGGWPCPCARSTPATPAVTTSSVKARCFMARILEARPRRGKRKALFQSGVKRERIPAMKWLAVLAATTAMAAAQAPKTGDVVARIGSYASEYGARLENVVSEETYQQFSKSRFGLSLVRNLRSDYALTYVGGSGWIGYRD